MSTKKIIVATATAFVVAGGAILATNTNQPLEAESTLPIVEQVEEHEVRITDLEGRADSTEATVQEQGQQIQQVQRTVTNTANVLAPQQAPTTTQEQPAPTPEPSPAPAPAPQPTPQPPAPEPHPRTIIAVSVSPEPTIPDAHVCRYKLYSALETSTTGTYTQPNTMPCMSVGEVLPK